MSINKNNYQAFFLDYHEGNLSPQRVADLLLFIEQHPELKEEFENFENFTLEDLSSIKFENKSNLKKQITLENKDDYFIRSVENTLNTTEKSLLTNFIKQHPQYLYDLELFNKTKLPVDDSIKFENKNALKRVAITNDDVLVSSVEGLLSKEEATLLNQRLIVDAKMKHDFYLYQQTKLIADPFIVFENKEELKRKEKKVIPLFYYVAIAASLLLLVGLSYLFNSNNTDKHFANELTIPKNQIQNNNSNLNTLVKDNDQETKIENSKKISAVAAKSKKIKKQKDIQFVDSKKNISNQTPVVIQEKQEENSTPEVISKEKTESIASVETKNSPTVTAQTERKNSTTKPLEYLSFGQLATEKIKEKALDANTLAIQKKTGRLKKLSGWDIAQIVTKGINKITGRNIEVKPTYNEDGAVTAYALGAGGFEFSKGK